MTLSPEPRIAAPQDAAEVAALLHDFNTEFDTPSPGAAAITPRLEALLAGDSTIAVLAGEPGHAVAVALVTLRPNVWYDGRVALLDELYVVPERRGQGIGAAVMALLLEWAVAHGVDLIEINVDEADVDAQRFYVREGFTWQEPHTGERAYYFHKEL